jgi:hypothetical protein
MFSPFKMRFITASSPPELFKRPRTPGNTTAHPKLRAKLRSRSVLFITNGHSPTSRTWLISFQERRGGLLDAHDPIANKVRRADRILERKNVTRSRPLAQSFPSRIAGPLKIASANPRWRHPEVPRFFRGTRACPERSRRGSPARTLRPRVNCARTELDRLLPYFAPLL